MKNPKLVVDGQDFLCTEKKVDKTVWRCCCYYSHSSTRCKVKLVTKGRVVEVFGEHNHPIKLKNFDKQVLSQNVTIIRNKKV